MLNPTSYDELIKIVITANQYLIDHNCLDFSITGINWDELGKSWCISYQSNYSNHEFINIFVKTSECGCSAAYHTFEEPEICLF